MPEPTFEELLDAMKAGAGALQRHEIPFVLGGGLAAWARGGPKSQHDVDFMIRPEDADAALEAMEQAGLRTERPPEGWLCKAWHENGALIDLIFSPSGGPITDETNTKDEKAQFILGPYGSAATATDAIVAEKNGIPMVEANGAAQSIFSKGYKFTFGVLSPANKYLTGVLDMAATLSPKPTTIAMLTANDNFSVEVAKAVEDYAPTKGFQVIFTKQYPAAAPEVSGLISQAARLNPDIVMNSGHLAESIAINKAAKQLGLNAKIFAYSVGPSTPDFIKALGADANYVFDGSQWTPQVKYKPAFYLSVSDYVKAYKTKYSTTDDPDYHVAESTAACLAFQKAIENAGSLDATKVRDALAGLDVMTFFGQIKFDSRGINTFKPMVVEQIQNGAHYTVFPADVANGKPQYPTPSWSSR